MDPFIESKFPRRPDSQRNQLHEELKKDEGKSYTEILGDISSSTKELILSDLDLVISEFKKTKSKIEEESKKLLAYSVLIALSTVPLLAFLVIGLGILLGGQYWLSALIVGGALAVLGGIGISSAARRFKKMDLDFSNTKRTIEKEKRIIAAELRNLKNTIKGEAHELQ